MIKQNVGTWDAYMRITGGLIGLAYGIRRSLRRDDALSALLIMASAIKVAEGVTRVCPMMHALGIATTEQQIRPEMYDDPADYDQDEFIPAYS
ncbi:YgaP family membrane protein [Effusibacillus consociatus]|uniref:DUF2892 domain-containing protein n=1 Tax=Effusibacillus consociatus TaxID=1117041 RepID=A0ABV9Q735_9BACL